MLTIVCFGDYRLTRSVLVFYNYSLKIKIKHRYNYTDSATLMG